MMMTIMQRLFVERARAQHLFASPTPLTNHDNVGLSRYEQHVRRRSAQDSLLCRLSSCLKEGNSASCSMGVLACFRLPATLLMKLMNHDENVDVVLEVEQPRYKRHRIVNWHRTTTISHSLCPLPKKQRMIPNMCLNSRTTCHASLRLQICLF